MRFLFERLFRPRTGTRLNRSFPFVVLEAPPPAASSANQPTSKQQAASASSSSAANDININTTSGAESGCCLVSPSSARFSLSLSAPFPSQALFLCSDCRHARKKVPSACLPLACCLLVGFYEKAVRSDGREGGREEGRHVVRNRNDGHAVVVLRCCGRSGLHFIHLQS